MEGGQACELQHSGSPQVTEAKSQTQAKFSLVYVTNSRPVKSKTISKEGIREYKKN